MTNKNFHIKTISSVLLVALFVFLAFASGEDKNEKTEVKTNFSSSEEIISYVKYRGYQSLKEEWGEAQLGHISLDNNGEFQIDLVWNKVKVNGRIVEFTFTKGSYGPETFVMVNCNYAGISSDTTNPVKLENSYSTSNNYVSNSTEIQTESIEKDSSYSSEDENDMTQNIKSADELEVADKKLNIIYKQVMNVLNEIEKTALRHEQRKWIKYRDISCEEETKEMNGSMYNAFLNNCKKEKTDKRIQELNEILESKK